ncbi:hypothetical protein Holit_00246 [Hollandina sp. SP2]
MKTGVDYTYTVIAVSSTSTSRGVEVVQNGSSEYTITQDKITKIPAPTAYTVAKVTALAAAKVTLADGSKAVQLSWTKDPNPGVVYQGEFNGNSFRKDNVTLSPDGKAVYNYKGINSLTDGEQYKATVTAYYSSEYYKAAEPAESPAYTHSGTKDLIENFGVSPVTMYNATSGAENGYEVSVYWTQTQTLTGLTYELYKHEGDNFSNSDVEWTQVTITQPTPDTLGFVQFNLSGDQVPARRKGLTFKLIAKVGGEEVASDTGTLNSGVWTSSQPSIWFEPSYMDAVSISTESGRKIKIDAEELRGYSSGMYAGEELEFYAIPSMLYNSSGDTTSSDQYLSTFTRLGGLSKANLENSDSTKRTITGTVPSNGYYYVIAVLKNGDTRIVQASLNGNDTWYTSVYN